MVTKKCLCVLRVSTLQQEIQSQKVDMISFLKGKFNDEEILWVESEGASAAKVDSKYLSMLDEIKNILTSTPTIKTVVFWHLNRLGRRKTYLDMMINYFRDNRIQLLTKVPELKLLNDDFSYNSASTLTLSVFSAMIEDDTREIAEKTQRGREYAKSQCKWLGGNLRLGFKVENGKLVQDPEQMELIREIYQLYSTGRYSYRTLYNELKSRGKDISYFSVVNLMQDERRKFYAPYVGEFKKQEHIGRPSKHISLASGLMFCSNCGCSYTMKAGHYICVHQVKKFAFGDCKEPSISAKNLDTLIKDVAYLSYKESLENVDEEEIRNEIKINQEKLSTAQNHLPKLQNKEERIKQLYIDGDISNQKYQSEKEKLKNEISSCNRDIDYYGRMLAKLNQQIAQQKEQTIKHYTDIMLGIEEINKDIVDRYIKKIELKRVEKYIIEVHITDFNDKDYKFIYNSKKWRYKSIIERERETYKVVNKVFSNTDVSKSAFEFYNKNIEENLNNILEAIETRKERP